MGDRVFGVSINLAKNSLNNAVLQPLSAAPSSPLQGQFYFDTVAIAPRWWDGSAWTNVATDSARLNGQLPAYYLARANHTGTQLAATISDFDTQVRTSRLDQMAAPTAPVSFNSQRITSVATPTAGTDAANKQYVDDTVAGLSWKDEVRVATTTNGALASAYANGQSVDGVTLATGDRILLKNQTTQSENGIYTVNASGAPTRATDSDAPAEIVGSAVYVSNGTTNGQTRWVNNNSAPITIGTTPLTFVSFGAGSVYTAGNGLNLSGNTFNVVPGLGIIADGTSTRIDTTVVSRKFAQDVGDGTSASITVTHNLGTKDVTVQLFANATPFSQVEADVQHSTTNAVTLVFSSGSIPTTAQYRCVVTG